MLIVLLASIAVLLLVAGPLAIWKPARFGLPGRFAASAVWGFWIVPFGIAVDLDPPPPQPGQADTGPAFPAVLVLWLVFVGAAWAVRRAFKREAPPPDTTRAVEEGIASIRRMKERAQPSKAIIKAVRRSKERAVVPRARRLEVLPTRSTMPDLGDGETSDFASFSYVDEGGRETERLLSDWWSDGRYIRGHCTMRGEERRFRKDRITNWRAW